MSHHPAYTMAALLGVGGVIGYVKKKSVPSLAAGLTLGVGFGIAGYLLQGGNMVKGHSVALAAGTLTLAGMGTRAVRTKKTLPIAVASIAAVSASYHAKGLMDWIGNE